MQERVTTIAIATVGKIITIEREIKERSKEIVQKDKSDNFITRSNREKSNIAKEKLNSIIIISNF